MPIHIRIYIHTYTVHKGNICLNKINNRSIKKQKQKQQQQMIRLSLTTKLLLTAELPELEHDFTCKTRRRTEAQLSNHRHLLLTTEVDTFPFLCAC